MAVTSSKQDQFHHLVKALSDVLGPSSGIDSDDVDPREIERIMSAYISDETEWQKYALSEPYMNYTRNLVDEGNGKSNLLLLVWNPGKGSPIHDHANAHCVMKLLKGSLKESLYQASSERGRGPQMVKETIYDENEVTYIHDKIGLHKISNPSKTEIAVSLHLYTPPHAANFGFNVFNEENGYAIHFGPTGFFSERGRKTKNKNKNKNSDCTTKPGTETKVSLTEVKF